jgi:hypothetical protein
MDSQILTSLGWFHIAVQALVVLAYTHEAMQHSFFVEALLAETNEPFRNLTTCRIDKEKRKTYLLPGSHNNDVV